MQSRDNVQTKSSGKETQKSAKPSDAGSVQMRKAISGANGFDAQSAALAPPTEWAPVQGKGQPAGAVSASPAAAAGDVHAAAAEGIASGGGALPHLGAVQKAFGKHDVGSVQAHTGEAASKANEAMGAEAYATGDHVAFGGAPDLHTVAHEAAHVVQQRGGVSLSDGVGKSGDAYEQHADQVADAVVKGETAEPILDKMSGGGGGGGTQQKAIQQKSVTGGAELVAVQEKLNKAGYDCGNADGIWGAKTMAAVKKFQADHSLTPDGAVGPKTLAALDSAAGGGGGGGGGGGDAAPKKTDDKPTTPEKKDTAGAGGGTGAGTGAGAGAGATKKDQAPAPPDEEKKTPDPVSGTRQAVAAAAFSQVGLVRAQDYSGKDEEGKPARVGWDKLADFFSVSFGGGWKDQDLMKHPRKGTKAVHGSTTGETVDVKDTLPSWCGIFAIWAVKSAGFSVGTWGIGKSAPNVMKKQNKVPQVGDVVVSSNHNHHAVVVWVAPDAAEKAAQGKGKSIEVKTVDGNSGSNPVSGGEIVDKGSTTMAKWDWGAWSPE